MKLRAPSEGRVCLATGSIGGGEVLSTTWLISGFPNSSASFIMQQWILVCREGFLASCAQISFGVKFSAQVVHEQWSSRPLTTRLFFKKTTHGTVAHEPVPPVPLLLHLCLTHIDFMVGLKHHLSGDPSIRRSSPWQ